MHMQWVVLTHAYDIGTRSHLDLHITNLLWGNPPVMRLFETNIIEFRRCGTPVKSLQYHKSDIEQLTLCSKIRNKRRLKYRQFHAPSDEFGPAAPTPDYAHTQVWKTPPFLGFWMKKTPFFSLFAKVRITVSNSKQFFYVRRVSYFITSNVWLKLQYMYA